MLLCGAGCCCARRGFSGRRALGFLRRPAHRWGLRGWCCSVRCPDAQLWLSTSNFARNSHAISSNIESTSLELQRLWSILKNDRDKLGATFIWRLCRCRPLGLRAASFARRVGSLSGTSLPPTCGREGPGADERVSKWPRCFARADCVAVAMIMWGQGWQLGPCAGSVNPFMRTWALLVERGQGCPCSTSRVNVRMKGPRAPPIGPACA